MASNRIVDKVVLATIQKASQRFVLEVLHIPTRALHISVHSTFKTPF